MQGKETFYHELILPASAGVEAMPVSPLGNSLMQSVNMSALFQCSAG